jgi:diaminopimelate epimerase
MDMSGHGPSLAFRKMHGAGNDFVVIDARGGTDPVTPALARAIGDRHRGVGFDQLAVIRDTDGATAALDFWNADGSRAGACGNATRCVAELLLADTGAARVTIRTVAGLLPAWRGADGLVAVDMGAPETAWQRIPLARAADTARLPLQGAPAAVSMGNPHCVFFVGDAGAVDLAALGPRIEHDPLFSERTNVEVVEVRGPDRLRMRVWERGAGITLACGSGACAAAVAAHARGLAGREVAVELDGGTLRIALAADGHVHMAGPVAHVFEGRLSAEFLAGAA